MLQKKKKKHHHLCLAKFLCLKRKDRGSFLLRQGSYTNVGRARGRKPSYNLSVPSFPRILAGQLLPALSQASRVPCVSPRLSGAGESMWTRLLFMYLFLAALALRCCTRAFSSPGAASGGYSSCSVWASDCYGFSCCRARALGRGLNSCGSWAL